MDWFRQLDVYGENKSRMGTFDVPWFRLIIPRIAAIRGRIIANRGGILGIVFGCVGIDSTSPWTEGLLEDWLVVLVCRVPGFAACGAKNIDKNHD